MAFLVWKEMDADLPGTKNTTRNANWLTEPSAPPPDPSPSGTPHQLPDPFAHTYQSRRLMRLSFFLV